MEGERAAYRGPLIGKCIKPRIARWLLEPGWGRKRPENLKGKKREGEGCHTKKTLLAVLGWSLENTPA